MHRKAAGAIANSVDYDQTAPVKEQSGLGLHCNPDLFVQHFGSLRYMYKAKTNWIRH